MFRQVAVNGRNYSATVLNVTSHQPWAHGRPDGDRPRLDYPLGCATLRRYPPCSIPFLSNQLPLIAAKPALAGHSMVASLVAIVDEQATELAARWVEIVELRRQLTRYRDNSGQPDYAGTTHYPVAVDIEHWSGPNASPRCGCTPAGLRPLGSPITGLRSDLTPHRSQCPTTHRAASLNSYHR